MREEDYTLHPTGNWSGYVQKTSGTTVLDQDRDHNHVNEIDVDDDHANAAGASITATTGINWADPTYDAAGNMTKMPRPKLPIASHTCTTRTPRFRSSTGWARTPTGRSGRPIRTTSATWRFGANA